MLNTLLSGKPVELAKKPRLRPQIA
jgi:hypothetical protein